MTLRFTIDDDSFTASHFVFNHLDAYFQSRLEFVDICSGPTARLHRLSTKARLTPLWTDAHQRGRPKNKT